MAVTATTYPGAAFNEDDSSLWLLPQQHTLAPPSMKMIPDDGCYRNNIPGRRLP